MEQQLHISYCNFHPHDLQFRQNRTKRTYKSTVVIEKLVNIGSNFQTPEAKAMITAGSCVATSPMMTDRTRKNLVMILSLRVGFVFLKQLSYVQKQIQKTHETMSIKTYQQLFVSTYY